MTNMKKFKFTQIIILILSITNLFFILNWFSYRNNEEYQLFLASKESKDNSVYSLIISKKSDRIALGEKYQAAVRLAYVNTNQIPTVLINDSVGKNDWEFNIATDTLIFDDYYNCFGYEYTPIERGAHFWNGIIIHEYLGVPDTLYFHVEYIVE
jgi:hypothetical protein